MDKKILREQGLTRLKQLDPRTKQTKEQIIQSLLFASKEWLEAESIGVIRSLPFEFDTKPIFERGFHSGKQIAVPRSVRKKLHFYQVEPQTEYQLSSFGVEEPLSQKNRCIGPGSFDRSWFDFFLMRDIGLVLAAVIMIGFWQISKGKLCHWFCRTI